MKIRTDPRSVATDAVAMAVSTMEHVIKVSATDREYLTTALNSYATDLSLDTDAVVSDILYLTQSVLTTPVQHRSVTRVLALLAAGRIVPNDDPLTRYLGTVTDIPLSGQEPWARLDGALDGEFMSRFTPEWWNLANRMLDAIYMDICENGDSAVPLSLLMNGVLPPMVDALHECGTPELGEFPGELLVTMFADQVATRLVADIPYAHGGLAAWIARHLPSEDGGNS